MFYRLLENNLNYGTFGRIISREDYLKLRFNDRALFYPIQDDEPFEWAVTRSDEGVQRKIFYKFEDKVQFVRFLINEGFIQWQLIAKILGRDNTVVILQWGPTAYRVVFTKTIEDEQG